MAGDSVNQVRLPDFPNPYKTWGFMGVLSCLKQRKKISQCVEALCSQGCSRVSGFIAGLKKAGEKFPELAGFNTQQRQQALDELVSVMAAYEGRCEH
jgi:hypothetical protein